MVKNIPQVFILTMTCTFLMGCESVPKVEIRSDFSRYYDEYKVEGSFVLYDQQLDKYVHYNREQYEKAYSPASTFKICNTLIGLETGVIPDESFMLPWDSLKRNPVWDQNHDLQSAFRNSVVWYYQEVARRIGGERMKFWLYKSAYGNADTSGGIDLFWLDGGLRISPEQQIDFLRRLHNNQLPFSKRAMDITKRIMIEKDTLGYILRAKTGWGYQDSLEVGWYVGYVEKQGKTYYFANCIQTPGKRLEDVENARDFDMARREIAYKILNELGLTR